MSLPTPPPVWGAQHVDFNHPAAGVARIESHQDGRVVELMPDGITKRTKLAIVGFAQSSTMDAPFHDPEYSIWGMNQLYRFIPRADRWFEIHHNYLDHVVPGTDHDEWLRTCQIPVYMNEHHDQYPTSVRYPIERMIEEFTDYFTSSIAFMLALGISEGFTTIDLYGVDLSVGVEYIEQRPCAEYFIGLAVAKGINVGIPERSALCKQNHRYGYESAQSLVSISKDDIVKRRSDLLQQRDSALKQLHYIEGALTDCDMWLHGLEVRSHQAAWVP